MDEAKLRDIPMFASLSRKQRKALALRADEVDVQPGRLVCRKGDSANELYVIEEGTAKVCATSSTSTSSGRATSLARWAWSTTHHETRTSSRSRR